jgi:alanyl-tRNA synthetase
MKSSNEIRKEFIDYFINKDHKFIKSSPVAPLDDPTLLFTNAGMNQFKDIFLAKKKAEHKRAVNSQKVIRASGKHNDLDDVGHDTYHHTFFEMLGNWSFGDYYKKEAITWAWDLLTNVWGLNKDQLWATVYKDDQEAFKIWETETDINPEHILYFDDKDNFWEMGSTGPCGPCSEIHFDRKFDPSIKGDDPEKGVNSDSEQFIEIWNLVFMQYFRNEDRSLTALKNFHVDTGMGFERIVSILQNKKSNYETDVFTPLIETLEKIARIKYSDKTKAAYHVAVDHIRTLCFAIADGAMPSNEGRGYVLRRMLRRALRYGREIGFQEAFLYQLVDCLSEMLIDFYPEINEKKEFIKKVIKAEEEQFNRTLDKGLSLFQELSGKVKKSKQTTIKGKDAFKLYDTYGFPLDLTELLANEQSLSVDIDSFNKEMEIQKERARSSGKFNVSHQDNRNWIVMSEGNHSEFIGYEKLESDSLIRKYAIDQEKLFIVIDKTPCYPESGGQVSDKASIQIDGMKLDVSDIQKDGDQIIHVISSVLEPKTSHVKISVLESNRRSTTNNHTATHLLHKALKMTLGEHVNQAGSFVDDQRLRFDFTHFEKINSNELEKIETLVNSEILKNTKLKVNVQSYDDAVSDGAMALFGEKYGDEVRVVNIGSFSKELCGGTHVASTGQIGSFHIISEGSISSGIRRIEAITGFQAYNYMQKMKKLNKIVLEQLQVTEEQIPDKINQLITEKKQIEKQLELIREDIAVKNAKNLLNNFKEINSIKLITEMIKGVDGKTVKSMVSNMIENQSDFIIAIASVIDEKIAMTVAVSKNLIDQFQAGKIVSEMAKICGGGGGGKPDVASAGAKDIHKIDDAFNYLKRLLEN